VIIKETLKNCAEKNFVYVRDIVKRYCFGFASTTHTHTASVLCSRRHWLSVTQLLAVTLTVRIPEHWRHFMFWMLMIRRGPKILYPR